MKTAAVFILVLVTFCVGYRKGYSDGCRVAVTEQTIPASSDGVLGPFISCKQEYAGDLAPMKNARMVNPSGEDKDTALNSDPFGVFEW